MDEIVGAGARLRESVCETAGECVDEPLDEEFDPVVYINEPRWRKMDLGLHRIQELLDRLGRPQDALRFVHVAGTNGKGSVCAYLASVLQAAGLRTGLFTSPYIERFEERIRVDGCDIPAAALHEITLRVREEAEAMREHPTEFELMCAVALMHFARSECDIVVLEVGLGGRWDATNAISAPDVCVICRLGLDHTDLLGETIGQIAEEKAGIIKPGCRVVSWPQVPEAMQVVRDACAAAGLRESDVRVADFSQLHVLPLRGCDSPSAAAVPAPANVPAPASAPASVSVRGFSYRSYDFNTRLLGSYQPSNAALAVEAALALRDAGWDIPEHALEKGIAAAQWPGRFEICAYRPLFVVDGGHNPQGAQAMAETLRELLPGTRPVFLIGILADKDYEAMLREVAPFGSAFVCVTPDNPRALPAEELARTIRRMRDDVQVEAAESIAAGVARARELAGAGAAGADASGASGAAGAVCAFGSLYSVGPVKAALREAVLDDAISACGFDSTGSCAAACLVHREEVRSMCSADRCGKYGRAWSCPPGCGTLDSFRELSASKSMCYVVQTVGVLEDDFDVENMMAASDLHKERFAQLRVLLEQDVPGAVFLGSGACTVCAECAYPDAPCRFPAACIVSMEAAGLMVSDICESAAVPYYHGRGTIAYTSCVLA